jgi:hypothetical protein
MIMTILKGLIYRFKRGQKTAYSQNRRYNCLSPASDWTETILIGDVWVCDRQGNIDPGLNVSPVPVSRDTIGAMIGRMP